MKKGISIIMLAVLLCSASLFAQYVDHGNRKVDSLEQVLRNGTLLMY